MPRPVITIWKQNKKRKSCIYPNKKQKGYLIGIVGLRAAKKRAKEFSIKEQCKIFLRNLKSKKIIATVAP